MSPARTSRRTTALLGLVGGLLMLATATGVAAIGLGWLARGYELQLTMPRAGVGLDDAADVRIRGMVVGEVTAIATSGDGTAELTLRIDDDVTVPASTVATVQPTTIFGPKYVDLDTGGAPDGDPVLVAGDRLVADAAPTELDEALDGLADLFAVVDTDDVSVIVGELATGLAGQEEPLGANLDASGEVLDLLDRRADDVASMISGLAELMDEVADTGPGLLRAGDDLAAFLGTIDRREEAFGDLLTETSRVSTAVTTMLDEQGDDLDGLIDGVAAATAALDGEAERLPDLLTGVASFFDALGGIAHVAGPGDSLAGAIEVLAVLETCELLDVVACPSVPAAAPAAADATGTAR